MIEDLHDRGYKNTGAVLQGFFRTFKTLSDCLPHWARMLMFEFVRDLPGAK